MTKTVEWRCHTPNLLKEVLKNPGTGILIGPLNIFRQLLAAVGERAAELNDPELNALMMRLTIYEAADMDRPDYDPNLYQAVMDKAKAVRT